jgi:SprT protein
METIQDQARRLTKEYIDKARSLYDIEIPYPSIEFNLKGTTAGKANASRIRFNATLLSENTETFLLRTVPHEVAHVVVQHKYPNANSCYRTYNGSYRRNIKPHGKEWKQVMRDFEVEDIGRCHSYDTENVRSSRSSRSSLARSFSYKCACQIYNLTIVRHRRILKGQTYSCKKCKQKLVYQG